MHKFHFLRTSSSPPHPSLMFGNNGISYRAPETDNQGGIGGFQQQEDCS